MDKEEKITLNIDKITMEKFRRYCAVNAYKISAKIQRLMEEEMQRGPKSKNLLDMFKDIIRGNKPEIISNEKRVKQEIPVNQKSFNASKKVPTIDELMRKKVNK